MKLFVFKQGDLFLERSLSPSRQETIGRSRSNTIHLSDPRVSRHHAQISFDDGGWWIEDKGSQNGVLYRGRPLKKERMHQDQMYDIGPFTLKITDTTLAEQAVENTDAFLTAIAVTPKQKETVTAQKPVPEPSAPKPETRVLKGLFDGPPRDLSSKSIRAEFSGLLQGDTSARLVALEDSSQEHKERSIGEKEEIYFHTSAKGTQKATIVSPQEGTFILRAEHSFPEVKVGGVPVRERELENHDVIEMGNERFEFVTGVSQVHSRKTGVQTRLSKKAAEEKNPLSLRRADWRTLMVLGLFIGLVSTYWLHKSVDSPQHQVIVTESSQEEQKRLRILHLTQAQDLMREEKFNEAQEKLEVLLTRIAPGDEEGKKLLEQLAALKKRKEQEAIEKRKVEKKTQDVVRTLVEEGDALLEKDKVSEAKQLFKKALELNPESVLAQAALEHALAVEEEQERERLAQKKTNETLEKIYQLGVDAYEADRFAEARQLLSEVVKHPSFRRYSSAKRMLSLIPRDSGKKTSKSPPKAKASSEELPPEQAPSTPEQEAKAAFKRGQTFLEITHDPAEALDEFEKVIQLLPDPTHELHQKAQQKIRQLQMEP